MTLNDCNNTRAMRLSVLYEGMACQTTRPPAKTDPSVPSKTDADGEPIGVAEERRERAAAMADASSATLAEQRRELRLLSDKVEELEIKARVQSMAARRCPFNPFLDHQPVKQKNGVGNIRQIVLGADRSHCLRAPGRAHATHVLASRPWAAWACHLSAPSPWACHLLAPSPCPCHALASRPWACNLLASRPCACHLLASSPMCMSLVSFGPAAMSLVSCDRL